MTRSVGIVGAGIIGLSTAWFLQEQGVEVTVLDRREAGAGASHGNAGWLSPALTMPLPEPSVLAYGIGSLLRRDAPFRVPPRSLLASAPFLLRFASFCTSQRFERGLRAFQPIAGLALASYDTLALGGVSAPTHEASIVAAYEDPGGVLVLQHELELATRGGLEAASSVLAADELHASVPLLSARARHGLRVEGQRWLDPAGFVASLAESVLARGGRIEGGATIEGVEPDASGVALRGAARADRFDDVVIATGAWLPRLARRFGVRVPLAAGRGYSLNVETTQPLVYPLYLPASRVACTPVPGGVRLAGTMEIASPDAPLDRRRIDAIVRSASALLSKDVRLDRASQQWVGPRPITADGLPLIGTTAREHVFVAGGHGMWGMTLGPATGQLLAELVTTGTVPPALRPFDPCR